MEPAVSMVLTTVLWSFTAWDDFEDTWSSWLQSEVEDRLSGWNRAPQQGSLNPPPGTVSTLKR